MKPSSSEISSVHQWLRRTYGKADRCEHYACMGESKNYDWSLIDGKEHERRRKNYRMLCRQCHFKYDWKNGRFDNQKKTLPQYGVLNGSKNGKIMCKFDEHQISDIRNLYSGNYKSQYEIARLYKVHQSTISLIVNGRTYAKAK